MLILGGINNFALQKMYDLLVSMANNGIISVSFGDYANIMASLEFLIPYIDLLWFGSFMSMVISSVIFSYYVDRKNYFSTFSFAVFGVIIFTYIGSYFVTLTEWFRDEILEKVFPNVLGSAPYFNWYLDNLGVINLILIIICIIANFVEIDFSRFNKPKEGDSIGEI